MSEVNQNTALFMQLVMTFQAAAWQQMGKIKNPMTDAVERHIEQARYSIDMLIMLRSKTKGNLSDDELKFLNHVISELQLNFVDELKKDEKAKEGGTAATDGTPEDTGQTAKQGQE